MRKHPPSLRNPAILLLFNLLFLTISSYAQLRSSHEPLAGGQITFTTTTQQGNRVLWRIQADSGAAPENLSNRLDSITLYPGTHRGPISVSPDGAWYVFLSDRFDSSSPGWPDLQSHGRIFNQCRRFKPVDKRSMAMQGRQPPVEQLWSMLMLVALMPKIYLLSIARVTTGLIQWFSRVRPLMLTIVGPFFRPIIRK